MNAAPRCLMRGSAPLAAQLDPSASASPPRTPTGEHLSGLSGVRSSPVDRSGGTGERNAANFNASLEGDAGIRIGASVRQRVPSTGSGRSKGAPPDEQRNGLRSAPSVGEQITPARTREPARRLSRATSDGANERGNHLPTSVLAPDTAPLRFRSHAHDTGSVEARHDVQLEHGVISSHGATTSGAGFVRGDARSADLRPRHGGVIIHRNLRCVLPGGQGR